MKPLRYAVLAGLCAGAVALTSCGGGGEKSGGGGGGGAEPLRMGIAVANYSLNFAREMYQGAQAAAKDAGNVDFKVVGPPSTEGPALHSLFQNLMVTHPDGLVLFTLHPPIFTRTAAQAVDRGIPLVALDTQLPPGGKVDFFVGNDNYALGAMLAEETVRKLGKDAKGEVIVGVPNPGAPVLDHRAEGIKETLNKRAPGIKVLGPFQTYSDPAQTYGAWQSLVNAHPDALAFLGVGDADSYNLGRLKEEKKGDFLTAGFDVDPKTLEYIKKGTNFTGVDPEHFLKGYVSTAVMIKAVRSSDGKLPKGWFPMPGQLMNSGNIDEIIAREKSPQAAYQWYKPQIDELLADVDARIKPMSQAR